MKINKTAIKILSLYYITSIIFLIILIKTGYEYKKNLLIENVIATENIKFKNEIKTIFEKFGIEKTINFIKKNNINVIILNNQNSVIFSNFNYKNEILTSKKRFFISDDAIYGKISHSYKKNRHFFILEVKNMKYEFKNIQKQLIYLVIIFLFLIILISYFLVKFSLKPLYENINLLDNFIKDSAHEIKTPLSIILMSLEMINKNELSNENQKYFKNIQIATNSFNKIYEDLVYINFYAKKTDIINFNLTQILSQRLELFRFLYEQKNLKINQNLEQIFIKMDINKCKKLLDNILSNIEKYAQSDSIIHIKLTSDKLCFTNTSKNELPTNINDIFKRYKRFNSNKGGFGLGLYIVKQICDESGIKIQATTNKKELTITLEWN